jgi:hypothetical protein
VYSVPIDDLELLSNDRELTVVLTCMGTAQNICCRDNTNIAYISADIGVWKYVDWDCFDFLSECYTTFKTVTLYNTLNRLCVCVCVWSWDS